MHILPFTQPSDLSRLLSGREGLQHAQQGGRHHQANVNRLHSGASSEHSNGQGGSLRKAGFAAFEKQLEKTYEFLANRGVKVGATELLPATSAENVANNILGFIEHRVKQDIQKGASTEEISQRLEEGLAGFKQGFAEAKEKLESLGFLSPEINEDIGKTYELVTAGIDDLKERYLARTEEPEPARSTVGAALEAGFGEVRYGQSSSFEFEVETAEGDTVTIQASSKSLYVAQYRYGAFNQEGTNGDHFSGAFEQFSSNSQDSSRFSFSVDGDLNADEMSAINDLLGRVEDLSQTFFSGDVEGAFNQAVNLGYDQQEIVGYSLNLRQVEVERVTAAYQQFLPASPAADNGGTGFSNSLLPVGDFARGVLDAVDAAHPFADPARLISDLAGRFEQLYQAHEEAESPSRFERFVGDILDALPEANS
ncbi:hypothetical protein NBRC116494_14990 [Aurantivibrio plasticivorans]